MDLSLRSLTRQHVYCWACGWCVGESLSQRMCTFLGPHTFVTSVLNGMRPGNEASNFMSLGLVQAQIVLFMV